MRRVLVPGWVLVLAACSQVEAIDAPRRPLEGREPDVVRRKSDESAAAKDFASAWNHELHAGADRSRLEGIALSALEADAPGVADMLEQLRKAHGGLTEDARRRVAATAASLEAQARWTRSAEVHLLTADDPPAYGAAWDVYVRAPPKDALRILEKIQSARKDFEEETGKKAE